MKKRVIIQRKFRSRRSGMGSAAALLYMMGLTGVGVTMMSLAMTAENHGDRTTSKLTAQTLAESGVNDLYDQIRQEMLATGTYPFDTGIQTVMVGTDKLGQYYARVVSANTTTTEFDSGSTRLRRVTYNFVLEGQGEANQYAINTRLQTSFNATIDYKMKKVVSVTQPGSSAQIWFPTAALASNEGIEINTDGGFRTYSADGSAGHVVANAGIEWNGVNTSKVSNKNPNVLDIQGQFIVPQSSYSATVGPNGIGNLNGVKNYRSPAIAASNGMQGNPADTVMKVAAPINFADSATVDGWKTNWLQVSRAANAHQYASSVSSSTIPPRQGDQWKVITAPAYIDGDLLVNSGTTIRLMPFTTNPSENIVYVKGNVSNLGQLKNLGVKLVIEGKYTDAGSSVYSLDTQGSIYATRDDVLSNAAMLSVNKSKDSITFKSNSTVTTGLVYSTVGGIKINTSTAEFSGMLIAGGTNGKGGIEVSPANGASFTMHYEPKAGIPGDFTPPPSTTTETWTVDGVASKFKPDKLKAYRKIAARIAKAGGSTTSLMGAVNDVLTQLVAAGATDKQINQAIDQLLKASPKTDVTKDIRDDVKGLVDDAKEAVKSSNSGKGSSSSGSGSSGSGSSGSGSSGSGSSGSGSSGSSGLLGLGILGL